MCPLKYIDVKTVISVVAAILGRGRCKGSLAVVVASFQLISLNGRPMCFPSLRARANALQIVLSFIFENNL
jgi:hypothetical protein